MTVTAVAFHVRGIPYPQGSKVAMITKAGKARTQEQSGVNLAMWRNAIVDRCSEITRSSPIDYPLTGPLKVDVTFRYRMPASRLKSDRVHGYRWRSTGADLDKLCRTLGDGLTIGGLIADDSRISEWCARKIEVHEGWVGADVTISELSTPVFWVAPLELDARARDWNWCACRWKPCPQ
jgi:Holliday junction resolvase RusA-like endonuclease